MYKGRKEGCLGLTNVKFRDMAELMKALLETAINPMFRRNLFHQALYSWHVEGERNIHDPGKPAYYSTTTKYPVL